MLIGFTSVFDYFLGLAIASAREPVRKRLLILDIAINLGLLATFKYLNFFIDSTNMLLAGTGMRLGTLQVILPIGISFFVFEAMSYCIDIYRGQLEPCRRWRDFGLFIFFFPRMIAGPIIRPADFLPQLEHRLELRWPNVLIGGQMFLLGMTKKLVIADNLAPFSDLVFANPTAYSGSTLLQAALAYTIQIFCDFSGYSDMALGLARLLGIDLPVNFRLPYVAANLTDFWRRWHISLSSWLRDYLYIPLGGNRRGTPRTYVNLFLTMVLGGLWHGASWHFVVWGALHGLGLAMHKAYRTFLSAGVPERSGSALRALSWAVTFAYVVLTWIFFRCQSVSDALVCVSRIAGWATSGIHWSSAQLLTFGSAVIGAHFVASARQRHKPLYLQPSRFPHLVLLLTWILGIFFLAAGHSSPFIYFQF